LLLSAVLRRRCCWAADDDISSPHGAQQQTRRTLLQRANDETDRRTDGYCLCVQCQAMITLVTVGLGYSDSNTEPCDGRADEALRQDENRHEREPVTHRRRRRRRLLLLLVGMVTVTIATLGSVHITHTHIHTRHTSADTSDATA